MKQRRPGSIPLFVLAAALGLSESGVRKDMRLGKVPPHDLQRCKHGDRLWSLDTIRAWRPDVAAKALRVLAIHAEGAA